jgi:heme-degrading monooxygenase HmoA
MTLHATTEDDVSVYLSMQRVRFSSPDAYLKFAVVFGDVRHHLMTKPGFIHLTWWVHPDDPTWYNEVSFWASKEATMAWHMDTYHKYAKTWAANGAIMEDIITNFDLESTRLLRICPTCGLLQDKEFDLRQEQAVLAQPCPQCGFHFPVMAETANSTAVFKDIEVATVNHAEMQTV